MVIGIFNSSREDKRIQRKFFTIFDGVTIFPVDCRAILTWFCRAHNAQNPEVRPSAKRKEISNSNNINTMQWKIKEDLCLFNKLDNTKMLSVLLSIQMHYAAPFLFCTDMHQRMMAAVKVVLQNIKYCDTVAFFTIHETIWFRIQYGHSND